MVNKIKSTKLGFTLTETLIVISIFGVVAAASFLTFTGARSQAVLDDAQASVVNALERARSRAATGVGTTTDFDHGVRIDVSGKQITNFRSDGSVTTTEENATLPPNISIIGSNQEIIFDRLSAISSVSTTITLEHIISGITTTVSVTGDGIIEK
jgi:prepilin-type N-terminal cleavage/methylation domain-containing protein